MAVLNGRFLGMSSGNLSEAYSGAAEDGLWDDVDMSVHQPQDYAQSGTGTPANLKAAWFIIILALGLLWLLGGIVFRVALQ